MKYLITGGGGFIGHNVTRFLEEQGHECLVVDTFTDYGFIPRDEIDYLVQERLRKFKSEIYDVDIRNVGLLEEVFKRNQFDCVIHLASFPRQKVVEQDPRLASEVMATGLINLLELSKNYSVSKFVYISSSMVYGDFEQDVKEDAPCNPIGQYGIMKYMGEKLVEDYTRRGCFKSVIIRPSAVYGEWDVEDRVVSKFMTRAMRGETLKVNGASEVLDFTYVEDTATGITLAATNDQSHGIYNITRSDTKLWTLKEAAELAISIAGRGQLQVADRDLSFPKRGRLDITRAQTELGYNPQVGVEEGFRRYYSWYNEHPSLWIGGALH